MHEYLTHERPLLPCSYVFHYMVEKGITYLCLADEKQKRRIPFLFLDDIKVKFQGSYGERANVSHTPLSRPPLPPLQAQLRRASDASVHAHAAPPSLPPAPPSLCITCRPPSPSP